MKALTWGCIVTKLCLQDDFVLIIDLLVFKQIKPCYNEVQNVDFFFLAL